MSGKQRYLCKVCELNFTIGDLRERYSDRIKRSAIELYVEGCGFRRISRLLKKIFNVDVCYQLIIKWIKSAAQKIAQTSATSNREMLKVPLLEMDELYTYIKKNRIKSEYGLLLIETGCVLPDLRSATQAQKLCENSGKK
jgi:transposase-like protein